MVYEPEGTDHDNVSWEVNPDGSPVVDHSIHEADEISADDDEGQQEEQESCTSLEENNGSGSLETKDDSDQNMDDQVMSPEAASTTVLPESNSLPNENLEAAPSMQKSHWTRMRTKWLVNQRQLVQRRRGDVGLLCLLN